MANPNPTHKFSSDNQPTKRRQKNILTRLQELVGEEYKVELSKADKFKILESMLEKSQDELNLIMADSGAPIFMRMLARGIKDNYDRKRVDILDTIFDRVYGRPKQDLSAHMSGEMTYRINFNKPRFREREEKQIAPPDSEA
jgi:hypothetical protein